MSRSTQLSPDIAGLTIAVLVLALIGAVIGLYWQAQVIAKQEAVIRMQMEGPR